MKPTFKFVLLMLVCSIIFICYALVPEKPLLVGEWGLRQIGLRRLLTKGQRTERMITMNDSTAKPREKNDTTSQHILFIGDSMSGLLCYPMSEYAEENGHTMDCVTWTSSSTHTWANCDTLRNIVNRVKPTYVFVCIGSNELQSRDIDGMDQRIHKILGMIGNVPTVWIGPPNWCKDGGINDLLLEIMGKGNFFCSKDLQLPRRGDGRHPTPAGARIWMDAIAKWMNDGNVEYMIKMKKPVNKKGKMDLTVLNPNGAPHVLHNRGVGPGPKATGTVTKTGTATGAVTGTVTGTGTGTGMATGNVAPVHTETAPATGAAGTTHKTEPVHKAEPVHKEAETTTPKSAPVEEGQGE